MSWGYSRQLKIIIYSNNKKIPRYRNNELKFFPLDLTLAKSIFQNTFFLPFSFQYPTIPEPQLLFIVTTGASPGWLNGQYGSYGFAIEASPLYNVHAAHCNMLKTGKPLIM